MENPLFKWKALFLKDAYFIYILSQVNDQQHDLHDSDLYDVKDKHAKTPL